MTQTITDEATLTAAGTPQNLALLKLQDLNPELDPNNLADRIEITQKYVLNTLYFTTGGGFWVNNTGWTTASRSCDWFGIRCDENDRARGVNLDENDLFGPMPSEIRGLTDLGTFKFVPRTEKGFRSAICSRY